MRVTFCRILPLVLIVIFIAANHAPVAASMARDGIAQLGQLTVEVMPTSAPVDSIVTLHITYSGEVPAYLYIEISPDGALRFDPSRYSGCYPGECSEVTLRTQTIGKAYIHVRAEGEIYDTDCQCWRFIHITDGTDEVNVTGGRAFLPVVQR